LAGSGIVVAVLVVLFLRTPPAPAPAPPPPPPAVERPAPALQADAEGDYLAGYRFTVDRLRFVGFSLRPDPVVSFVLTSSGSEQPAFCEESLIRRDSFHLRCDHDRVGTVTIDGRFLTRVATGRLGAPVVSAVVTVRSPSGETLYSARDSFQWQPAQ
jgi:hypothetical protein